MIKSEIYAVITEKIIANLESCGSWQQMWRTVLPVSLNGHVYRGINRMILANDHFQSRVYGTFQQIRANGGQVRKGEKSTLVVFWKRLKSTDPITLEEKTRYMLRYFHVFNTEQAHFDEIGKQKIEKMNGMSPLQPIVGAEQIIQGYSNAPPIIFDQSDDSPCYYPTLDEIHVPPMNTFETVESFYRVTYHECLHSTMHESRLNRLEGRGNKFGDENYTREELVAELGSAFLANVAGFSDLQNPSAYIRNWAGHMRDNNKLIVWAASRAEKAAEYILGTSATSQDDEQHAELVPEEAVEETAF
jgi:antirestriction protein ArdC